MKKELLLYLKEEREISSYRIETLEKGPPKNYKARLISIERDFINFKFEDLNFVTVDELREAIDLFKVDRNLFNEKYLKALVDIEHTEDEEDLINKKLKYYENLFKEIIDNKIKEVNIVQNSKIRDFLNLKIDPSKSGIDTISKIEGSRIGRKRARIQILLYCLARFIHSKIKGMKESNTISHAMLDNIFDFYEDQIFKYYNNGILEVPLITNGTLGHNNMLPTVYPLINIVDKTIGDLSIKRNKDLVHSIIADTGNPIKKKFVERSYSLTTEVNRVGNEWMDLLFLDLFSDDGTNINDIMTKNFYNHLSNNIYYKAISTSPIMDLIGKQHSSDITKNIASLIGLEPNKLCENGDNIIFNDSSAINKINNYIDGKIDICKRTSKILVAATRSEGFHIQEALEWLNLLINEIKVDYNKKFISKIKEENNE